MKELLSPPVSRALALAILIGVVGGLYYGIVRPIVDNYGATRASIEQLQDTLMRYQRAARDLAPRQAELAALKQRQSAQDGFLQGANDTLVAAQIQNRIKALADATKGELRSTQVLPSQDEGKLRRITVRGQMSTTLPGALRVFHGLESVSPLLFIDNVDMRARPAQLRDRSAAVNTDVIDLQFDVYGYTHASN
jgi:general secretion pathway protein M